MYNISIKKIPFQQINIPQSIQQQYNLYFEEILNFENRNYSQKLYQTLIIDSFFHYTLLVHNYNRFFKPKEVALVVDIGTGLGIPSIPIIVAHKNLNESLNLEFYLIEPNTKKFKFLEKIKKIFKLDFNLINSDHKSFYDKNKKKFDFVFCRAVFPPPKIFDIFKKYSKNFAFWQYSSNYQQVIQKYQKKLKENDLQITEIYLLFDEDSKNQEGNFTIIFKLTKDYFNSNSSKL